jgi:hypothetical protein
VNAENVFGLLLVEVHVSCCALNFAAEEGDSILIGS